MKARSNLIFLIVPIIFALQILTMPNDLAGDGNAIRKVSAWLAHHGEWGIPFDQRANLGRYLENRNQWFIESDEHQRFYSRWGEANTLIYAITEFMRGGDALQVSHAQLLYTNGLNAFFAMILALYWVLLGRLFKTKPWAVIAIIAVCFYATFVWHYLRMQTYEIFQLVFFTAFVFHSLAFAAKKKWWHLTAAMCCLFLAAHVKTLFFIFFPCSLWLIWRMKLSKASRRRATLVLLGAFGISLSSHLAIAAYKLGYFSLSGDAPPPEGWGSDFGLQYIPHRLSEMFLQSKTSLLLHFPQLMVSAVLWPHFHRKFQLESEFLLSCLGITALTLLTFCTYGEWCYGLRYWVFLLPILMLPTLIGWSEKKFRTKITAALLVLSAPMAALQLQFNSRPFFLRQNLNAFLANTEPASPRGRQYLAATHDAMVALQFNQFLDGQDNYPLLVDLSDYLPEEKRSEMRAELRQMLGHQFRCNYYFFCD